MKQQPNILFITTDQHRFDALGCNDNPVIRTPNIDRLAQEGVNFQQHYCSSPVCSPTRASMMTGLVPRSHGLFELGNKLPEENLCLPQYLSGHGYRTGLFGKGHFEALLSRHAENIDHSTSYYGFETFHITDDFQIGEYLDWIRAKHPQYAYDARDNCTESFRIQPLPETEPGKLNAIYTSSMPEHLHQTPWITGKTIDFIESCKSEEKPFFAWCSYVDPHHPWNPPKPYDTMYNPSEMPVPPLDPGEELPDDAYFHLPGMEKSEYQRMCAAYYGKISHIDDYVGKLINRLEELDLLENTIIIFTSDHGDYNGDRGLIRKCWRMYDNLLRVPLLVRMPGKQLAGKVVQNPTQDIDFLPTLLDLLELEIPDELQGYSFAAALTEADTLPVSRNIFCEFMWQLSPWEKGKPNVVTIKDQWKLSWYPHEHKYYLVNLAEDPYEYNNLYDDPACKETVRELKADLLEWILNTPWYIPPKEYNW